MLSRTFLSPLRSQRCNAVFQGHSYSTLPQQAPTRKKLTRLKQNLTPGMKKALKHHLNFKLVAGIKELNNPKPASMPKDTSDDPDIISTFERYIKEPKLTHSMEHFIRHFDAPARLATLSAFIRTRPLVAKRASMILITLSNQIGRVFFESDLPWPAVQACFEAALKVYPKEGNMKHLWEHIENGTKIKIVRPEIVGLRAALVWPDSSFPFLRERIPEIPKEVQGVAFEALAKRLVKEQRLKSLKQLFAIADDLEVQLSPRALAYKIGTVETWEQGMQIEMQIKAAGKQEPVAALFLLRLAAYYRRVDEATRIYQEYSQLLQKSGHGNEISHLTTLFARLFPSQISSLKYDGMTDEESIPEYMTLLLRQRKYDDVWKLFKYAKDHTETWNIEKVKQQKRHALGVISTQALDAACRCDNLQGVKEAFEYLKLCYPNFLPDVPLSVATDSLGRYEMMSEIADIWATRLSMPQYPDVNCWNSLIEALTRTKHYKQAYDIVLNFLRDCIDASRGISNKAKSAPDLKFARCCVQFLCRRPFDKRIDLHSEIPKDYLRRGHGPLHQTAFVVEGKRLLQPTEIVAFENLISRFYEAWKEQEARKASGEVPQTSTSPQGSVTADSQSNNDHLSTEEDASIAQMAHVNLADILGDEPEAPPLRLKLTYKQEQQKTPERDDLFYDESHAPLISSLALSKSIESSRIDAVKRAATVKRGK